MPLALVIAGVLFIVAAVRGKSCNNGTEYCHTLLFETLKSDFTGPKNFFYWGIALFIIGAVGYYKPLKPFSNAFLTLVIIALFFRYKSFPQSFLEQIGQTTNVDTGIGLNSPLVAQVAHMAMQATAMGDTFK